MTECIINLEHYRVVDKDGSKAKVFTGRDRGLRVREQSKIDDIEARYDSVVVIIPAEIYSINPSFFEELFKNVVRKLGKDRFYEKIKVRCDGKYPFQKRLEEAVDTILREQSAIG